VGAAVPPAAAGAEALVPPEDGADVALDDGSLEEE
jgi:hypothetical protein